MREWGNEEHLAAWLDDPWYPILEHTNERLEKIVPGYLILQIKEKFGGLRYYISTAEGISKETFDKAYSVINYAEAWVDGFEKGRKST